MTKTKTTVAADLLSADSSDHLADGADLLPPTGLIGLTLEKIRGAFKACDDFFFGPASGAVFALFRVAIGWVTFYWLVSLWPDLNWFFGDNTVDPLPYYGSTNWGFFRWIDAEAWFGPLWILAIVASIGVMTGKFVRISGIYLAAAVMSIINENNVIWNAGDVLIRIHVVVFAVACIVLPLSALQAPLFGRKDEDGVRYWPSVPAWALRLAQLQLTVIYANTVIEKLPGEPWRDGTAGAMALKLETMDRLWMPEFVTENLLIVNLMTWGALGLEIALPVILWKLSTRKFAIAAGVFMHFFFDLGLYIGAFSWAMYICYIAFFPQSWAERPLGAVGDQIDRLTSRFSQSEKPTNSTAKKLVTSSS